MAGCTEPPSPTQTKSNPPPKPPPVLQIDREAKFFVLDFAPGRGVWEFQVEVTHETQIGYHGFQGPGPGNEGSYGLWVDARPPGGTCAPASEPFLWDGTLGDDTIDPTRSSTRVQEGLHTVRAWNSAGEGRMRFYVTPTGVDSADLRVHNVSLVPSGWVHEVVGRFDAPAQSHAVGADLAAAGLVVASWQIERSFPAPGAWNATLTIRQEAECARWSDGQGFGAQSALQSRSEATLAARASAGHVDVEFDFTSGSAPGALGRDGQTGSVLLLYPES